MILKNGLNIVLACFTNFCLSVSCRFLLDQAVGFNVRNTFLKYLMLIFKFQPLKVPLQAFLFANFHR